MSTTGTHPHGSPDAEERATPARWAAVAVVALGVFAVVTAEQLPVGLLTAIGGELRVTDGVAGLMITAPGVVAALAAPLVPLAAGRLDRRWLLAALIVVLVVAHLFAAGTTSFAVLLASRVLVGLAIGGFWAIAGGLALRLVPRGAVPRATSLIFSGVAAANVLGVPAGTLIGELSDWRVAFAALGGLGAVVLAGLLVLLPTLPATEPVRVSALTSQLADPGVRAGIVATLLLVTGHFAAYTFVGPLLAQVSGVDPARTSSFLLGYGIVGLVGNFVAGPLAARSLRRTMTVICAGLALALALFPLLGTSPVGGTVLLAVWGLAFGGVSVSLQTWILQAAPRAAEAATALWVSTFNLSIALGALLGGRVVDALPLPAAPALAAVPVLCTLVALRATRHFRAG